MPKFIDHVLIKVISGDGGNGIIAWRREKYEPLGGPAGGTGGRGGHIYIEASKDFNTLVNFKFKAKFIAENGERGGSTSKSGKSADDIIIKVPVGTVIKDAGSHKVVADLNKPGLKVLVAEGGRGGRGNAAFATPTLRAPYFCEPGERGVSRQLELELKLLADVGIIGFPNAGKSTLLAALSNAKPKIAAYPFSTLEPNLGVVRDSAGDGYILADIPGLIEGASQGVGLGHKFLRHTERTRLLLHLVDISAEDPLQQIEAINSELHLFNPALGKKEQIIVLNKSDLFEKEEVQTIMQSLAQQFPSQSVMAISAAARLGLKELTSATEAKLNQFKKLDVQEQPSEPIVDSAARNHSDDGFVITRKHKTFFLNGDRVNRMVNVTDTKSPESMHHLNHVLNAMGAIEELRKQNIQFGDEVQIGALTFTYGENLF